MKIHVAHVLRKYHPAEWAGTETVLKNLITSWSKKEIHSKVFSPEISEQLEGPFEKAGIEVERYHGFLPIFGLTPENRERLISIGGNLMSFDLPLKLYRQHDLSIIHTHCFGLVGGIAASIAKARQIPLVVSVHGGYFDIPKQTQEDFKRPLKNTLSWGKVFSPVFRPDLIIERADAVITYNSTEEKLQKEHDPLKKVLCFPQGILREKFETNYQDIVKQKFDLNQKDLAVVIARIDPVKNQKWLVQQLPQILNSHPNFFLGLIGPITNREYYNEILTQIDNLGISQSCKYLGNFPNDDPMLIGLLQFAKVSILPSIAEPFGMVILESWASKTPILANQASGPLSLIDHRKNGWLFDVNHPESFHKSLEEIMKNQTLYQAVVGQSFHYVLEKYDIRQIANQVKNLYKELLQQ